MIRSYGKLVHVDAYRFDSLGEAETAGLRDVLADKKHIILVEWADKIRRLLPPTTILVEMKHRGENGREIIVARR